jgi:hypothetical protein
VICSGGKHGTCKVKGEEGKNLHRYLHNAYLFSRHHFYLALFLPHCQTIFFDPASSPCQSNLPSISHPLSNLLPHQYRHTKFLMIEAFKDLKNGHSGKSYTELGLEHSTSQILHHLESKDDEEALMSLRSRVLCKPFRLLRLRLPTFVSHLLHPQPTPTPSTVQPATSTSSPLL